MVSCIVLAAGESRRFGSPKALAMIHGQPGITRIQQTLLDAGLDEIVVVLGAHVETVQPLVFNHNKVRLVHNKDYKLGQTSSFQAGIRAAHADAQAFMLFPVDCPFIATSTVQELLKLFAVKNSPVLIPSFQGHRGHPPLFNASLRDKILGLSPTEQGINTLFEYSAPQTVEINDPGIVQTFNTPEELKQIESN